MGRHDMIAEALSLILGGICQLREAFPQKAFTIDGRLVGDIGEVIASLEYDLDLYDTLQAGYDGETPDGRKVQIKATFQESLTLRTVPDYYLGLKLHPDGRYEEVFNGPGWVIYERYKHRKGIGEALLSFPLSELRRLSQGVADTDRVPLRRL